jgi:Uma2 family endonuclease
LEIVESSWRRDLGPKLELYRRTGVAEYLAILIRKKTVQWRVLEDGQYKLLEPAGGVLKSRVFPGLWLDTGALFPPDRKRLLAGVDEGLRTARS